MIVGVGIDVVPVDRFAAALQRTPGLARRLFTATELLTESGHERTAESLAARFAAKEALAKALGAPGGMLWSDAEVVLTRMVARRYRFAGRWRPRRHGWA